LTFAELIAELRRITAFRRLFCVCIVLIVCLAAKLLEGHVLLQPNVPAASEKKAKVKRSRKHKDKDWKDKAEKGKAKSAKGKKVKGKSSKGKEEKKSKVKKPKGKEEKEVITLDESDDEPERVWPDGESEDESDKLAREEKATAVARAAVALELEMGNVVTDSECELHLSTC
jgi:hypothetical protein